MLGIESSCDDTGVAIVDARSRAVVSETLLRHERAHEPLSPVGGVGGGVVPAQARQAHVAALPGTVDATLRAAGVSWDDLSAVAVVAGPGLPGALCAARDYLQSPPIRSRLPPLRYAVNHLAAHALAARLAAPVLAFPYLCLVASGGHTQLLAVRGPRSFDFLGGTLDDPLGEALDKAARELRLSSADLPRLPGVAQEDKDRANATSNVHPAALLEAFAAAGAGTSAETGAGTCAGAGLPLAALRRDSSCNMSFSGLKSALKRAVAAPPNAAVLQAGDRTEAALLARAALAHEFQTRAFSQVAERTARAAHWMLEEFAEVGAAARPLPLVVVGGVARNRALLNMLQREVVHTAFASGLIVPPPELCTDNGAMVAWVGCELLSAQTPSDFSAGSDDLYVIRPKWPLSTLSDDSRVHPRAAVYLKQLRYPHVSLRSRFFEPRPR